MKRLLIVLVSIFVLIASIYSTDVGYKTLIKISERIPSGQTLFNAFENLFNEVDIIKKIEQTNLPDSDFVDLVLSADDLKDLQIKLNKFIDEGFIRDEINEWRKAKVLINGELQKVKYKIHGTSIYPLLKGVTFC